MLGKIVELSGIALKNGFEVNYGIDMYEDGRRDFGFASIVASTSFPKRTRVNYMYGYTLSKEQDLFKEYIIETDTNTAQLPNSEFDEEFLWVIIPYTSGIITNAQKVAGRNPTEAILQMRVEDTVEVRKAEGVSETYMVAKAGNELFLVKKNR